MSLPPGINPDLIPAATPPAGVISNFVNPVSRADAVIIANEVITDLMLLFVVLRLSAKRMLRKIAVGMGRW